MIREHSSIERCIDHELGVSARHTETQLAVEISASKAATPALEQCAVAAAATTVAARDFFGLSAQK